MLYGFSLLYGLTGTLDLTQIGGALAGLEGSAASRLALTAAVLLSLCGFGYKVAAVPFHMWCPDVYQGAPTPFTAFLSVGPKAAGLAVLMRFLLTALGDPTGTSFPWPLLIGMLAAITMTLGNLTALVQTNVKRLLAFSSIAHAGYLLMAVSVGSPSAIRAVQLYLVFYLLMNLGAFLAVQAVRARTGSENLETYRGLGMRSPLLAGLLALFLFSLTGLPPLAGFIGKFYLFAALLEAGTSFYIVLAMIGAVNSAISLYYYARVMKAMYLTKGAENATPVPLGGAYSVLLLLLAVPTLILGVYWFPLADALHAAVVLAP
jgi:NADH-quinone oxidoreductase subunit N